MLPGVEACRRIVFKSEYEPVTPVTPDVYVYTDPDDVNEPNVVPACKSASVRTIAELV